MHIFYNKPFLRNYDQILFLNVKYSLRMCYILCLVHAIFVVNYMNSWDATNIYMCYVYWCVKWPQISKIWGSDGVEDVDVSLLGL